MNIVRQSLVSMVVVMLMSAFAARAETLIYPSQKPSCEPTKPFSIIDISMPVPDLYIKNGSGPGSVLTAFRNDFKLDTIFRYYDDPVHPSIPGKPLRAKESDALLAAGFKIGVVFQHNSSSARHFVKGAGRADAKISWQLADENRQPYNTPIYFGVDGPFDGKLKKTAVVNYFNEVAAEFEEYAKTHNGNKYDIGIYCSADMCGVRDELKLKYMWISPSGRYLPEYKKMFANPKHITLLQSRESKRCDKWGGEPKGVTDGIKFDFDQANPNGANLGTWDHKRQ
jgi:hypothetical protein